MKNKSIILCCLILLSFSLATSAMMNQDKADKIIIKFINSKPSYDCVRSSSTICRNIFFSLSYWEDCIVEEIADNKTLEIPIDVDYLDLDINYQIFDSINNGNIIGDSLLITEHLRASDFFINEEKKLTEIWLELPADVEHQKIISTKK